MDRCLHFTNFNVMKGGILMKRKILSKNQRKVIAEILEKIALGIGAIAAINGVVLESPKISILEIWVLGLISFAFLIASVRMRRKK